MTTTTKPQTPQRFGLTESAIQAIQQVLAAHPEVEQAIVHGSRAMGRQRPASDIDLTLIGPQRWARMTRCGPSMLGASNGCDTTKQRQVQYGFTYGEESAHGHGVCHGSPQAVVCADR